MRAKAYTLWHEYSTGHTILHVAKCSAKGEEGDELYKRHVTPEQAGKIASAVNMRRIQERGFLRPMLSRSAIGWVFYDDPTRRPLHKTKVVIKAQRGMYTRVVYAVVLVQRDLPLAEGFESHDQASTWAKDHNYRIVTG